MQDLEGGECEISGLKPSPLLSRPTEAVSERRSISSDRSRKEGRRSSISSDRSRNGGRKRSISADRSRKEGRSSSREAGATGEGVSLDMPGTRTSRPTDKGENRTRSALVPANQGGAGDGAGPQGTDRSKENQKGDRIDSIKVNINLIYISCIILFCCIPVSPLYPCIV